jgi:hypothetical protein
MKRIGQGKKEYTVVRQYDAESEPIRARVVSSTLEKSNVFSSIDTNELLALSISSFLLRKISLQVVN